MKDLLDTLSKLHTAWPAFKDFTADNPIAAGVVATACVVVGWYAIIQWASAVVFRPQDGWRRNILKFVTTVVIGGVVSAVVVAQVHDGQVPRPVVTAAPDQIGHIELTWSYVNRKSSAARAYIVQAAADRRFDRPWERKTPFSQHIVQNPEESLHGPRVWRVGAIADTDGDPQNSRPVWSAPVEVTYYPSVRDRIIATKTVRIGFSATVDDGWFLFALPDGQLAGFDYLLANGLVAELGKRFGAKLRLKARHFAWEKLLAQPALGSVDMIISMITATKDRMTVHNLAFSERYYPARQVLVKSEPQCMQEYANAEEAFRFAANHGLQVGVHRSTTSAEIAQLTKRGLKTLLINEVRDSSALETGLKTVGAARWAFAIVDSTLADGLASRNPQCERPVLDVTWPDLERLGVLPSDLQVARENFGVDSGDTLAEMYAIGISILEYETLGAVNDAIREFRARGDLQKFEAEARNAWVNRTPPSRRDSRVSADGRR